jgi:hypothetical protein
MNLQLFSPFSPFFGPYLCWDCNYKATATSETVCVDMQGKYIMHSIQDGFVEADRGSTDDLHHTATPSLATA